MCELLNDDKETIKNMHIWQSGETGEKVGSLFVKSELNKNKKP